MFSSFCSSTGCVSIQRCSAYPSVLARVIGGGRVAPPPCASRGEGHVGGHAPHATLLVVHIYMCACVLIARYMVWRTSRWCQCLRTAASSHPHVAEAKEPSGCTGCRGPLVLVAPTALRPSCDMCDDHTSPSLRIVPAPTPYFALTKIQQSPSFLEPEDKIQSREIAGRQKGFYAPFVHPVPVCTTSKSRRPPFFSCLPVKPVSCRMRASTHHRTRASSEI